MKKVSIMQPYFFPYIGYFQLINSVDEFVIYDTIEFTKKGWINRNRILVNGTDAIISLPLQKDSDFLNINDRFLANTWEVDRKKMLNRISESYRKAPYFKETYELIEKCIMFEERNLFKYILNSVKNVLFFLNIDTKLIISSSISIDDKLKRDEKVMAICKERGADIYINPIGGFELYDKETFKKNNLELQFIRSNNISYNQFDNEFIPWLSIIDVMMFNSLNEIKNYMSKYELISN
jgi:hypothetical protein